MRKKDILRFRFVLKFKELVRNTMNYFVFPDKETALVNKKNLCIYSGQRMWKAVNH